MWSTVQYLERADRRAPRVACFRQQHAARVQQGASIAHTLRAATSGTRLAMICECIDGAGAENRPIPAVAF